jgi:hypothetical protein
MLNELIEKLKNVPQPPMSEWRFLDDLKSPLEYRFSSSSPVDDQFLAGGVDIRVEFPSEIADGFETALWSLRRVLNAKGIAEKDSDAYPITIRKDSSLKHEEYVVVITAAETIITASDADGVRRGVYFLEDRLCEVNGAAATIGEWRRKPYVKHRISRCFFGPTYRPPFFVDELLNDIDYYPEEYLNKLAHENINGLWLSMYFRDLPSSVFPGRGAQAEKRFAKLRQVVERCGRFGIRIYIYICEPKGFGTSHYSVPMIEAKDHPELIGTAEQKVVEGGWASFCTSNATAQKYFSESVTQLFTAVPDLGGIINIIFGEDNGACVGRKMHSGSCACPRCNERDCGEMFRETALTMTRAMHAINPDAEYLTWFYAPGTRDGGTLAKRVEEATANWPEECGLMLNFESGGVSMQLGKGRNVFDYSLAYIGPSELWRKVAGRAARPAAKLQVGCSHENASVPFIPVPGNLYEKYKTMHDLGTTAVMQCWYFGNYPGLMNKAAGELSFLPFPASEDEFLLGLARPNWREDAPDVVMAWKYFAEGYRQFPANIAFAWFGPLHHSIAWPLRLYPADAPISPSWILKNFPEVSGDRIGECLVYQHTLQEGIALCDAMNEAWQKGLKVFAALREKYRDDSARTADIDLADAIGLQIKSTCNLLHFYAAREEMFYERRDNRAALRKIVEDEVANTIAMGKLCERDLRLGYHSEAEGYLFFPAKLDARLKCLQYLLDVDLPNFRLDDSRIAAYTGEKPEGQVATCAVGAPGADRQKIGGAGHWSAYRDDDHLNIVLEGTLGKAVTIEIEPCRLWPPMVFNVSGQGSVSVYDFIFRVPPVVKSEVKDGVTTVKVPWTLFEGYRRGNSPIRLNILCQGEAWVKHEPWPGRLLHRNYNPESAGWLIL